MENQELMQKNKELFNLAAKYYDNWLVKVLSKYEYKKIFKYIKIKDNLKILDAGCGTGNLLVNLNKKAKNLKLYGIDISEEMLKVAERKLENKVKLQLMPVEKIKFKENSFDYVFSTETFHHFSDSKKSIGNFYKILKRNGKLIVLDFDFGFFLNKLFHFIEPGNNKMHSKKEFRKLFKQYKFKNIIQKRFGLFLILTIGEK